MLKTNINVPSGTSAVRAEQLLRIDSELRDARRRLLSARRLPLQVGGSYAEVFELPELFRYDTKVACSGYALEEFPNRLEFRTLGSEELSTC
jgi:hypothetical protein